MTSGSPGASPGLGSTPGGKRTPRCRTGVWAGPATGENIRVNGSVNKSICDSSGRTFINLSCSDSLFKIGNCRKSSQETGGPVKFKIYFKD